MRQRDRYARERESTLYVFIFIYIYTLAPFGRSRYMYTFQFNFFHLAFLPETTKCRLQELSCFREHRGMAGMAVPGKRSERRRCGGAPVGTVGTVGRRWGDTLREVKASQ